MELWTGKSLFHPFYFAQLKLWAKTCFNEDAETYYYWGRNFITIPISVVPYFKPSKMKIAYLVDLLETFLYSKFVQEETFFWLVLQYRMLNYQFKAGISKFMAQILGQVSWSSYLYSIFFLEETFAFQILVFLQYNRVLLTDDSP